MLCQVLLTTRSADCRGHFSVVIGDGTKDIELQNRFQYLSGILGLILSGNGFDFRTFCLKLRVHLRRRFSRFSLFSSLIYTKVAQCYDTTNVMSGASGCLQSLVKQHISHACPFFTLRRTLITTCTFTFN